MKFNEKLIELRKKQGLSQEELGYKLNVTRQTISKWELGQTTPEMDKLLELSKMFNISVDELIKETNDTNNSQDSNPVKEYDELGSDGDISSNESNPTIEDEPIENEKSNSMKEKNTRNVIIIALIIVVVLIIAGMVNNYRQRKAAEALLNGIENTAGIILDEKSYDGIFGIFERFFDFWLSLANKIEGNTNESFEKTTNEMRESFDNFSNTMNENHEEKVKEMLNTAKDKFKNSNTTYTASFNGGNMGVIVKEFLDEIINQNERQDEKVTVKYKEIASNKSEEIRKIKEDIDDSDDSFELVFKYYSDGNIKEITINTNVSETNNKVNNNIDDFEKNSFNDPLEIYSGTQSNKAAISSLLERVILTNNSGNRKVTVKFNETETQNESEIRTIKNKLENRTSYNVTFSYDDNGFINKATIEKVQTSSGNANQNNKEYDKTAEQMTKEYEERVNEMNQKFEQKKQEMDSKFQEMNFNF